MKLEIENIVKKFDGQRALDVKSIQIPSSKVIALLGPSGGGKSTFLRVLGGLELPDSGSLKIDDEPILFNEDYLMNYRRSIGTVFQAYNLFPHLTALENIELPLHYVHGLSAKEAKETALKFLARFHLEEHAFKKPAQLSGGQRQRTAIVRAVAIKPRFLFLDEPTSALDPLMTAEVLDLIDELRSEGIQIVLASHHISFVKQISDWAIFLTNGQVLEYGPTQDFFTSPKTAEAKNFLDKVLKY